MTKLQDVEINMFQTSVRFILDSGCSSHMCADKTKFDTLNYLHRQVTIEVADGQHIYAEAVGTIGILEDVYYVPDLKKNLISISAFDKKGYSILFEDNEVFMRRSIDDEFVLVGLRDGALYEALPFYDIDDTGNEFVGAVIEHTSDLDLWHERLAHLSYDNVKSMVKKDAVDGLIIRDRSMKKEHFCDACASAKATLKTPHIEMSSYRKQLLTQPKKKMKSLDVSLYFKEVNSDLIGPMQVAGICGSRYAIHFTEARSRYRWIYTMKNKNETVNKIKEFVSEIESLGFSLKLLKTDNGGEYVNDEVKSYAKGKFILRTTPPHTPQSNGISERYNRILGERTRAMLKHKKLPLFLWPEAMKTITYLSNRTTTVAVGAKQITPFELLHNEKPNVSHLKCFGCKAFAYNFDPNRRKLDDKAKAGVFVGYDSNSAAYRIYLANERKIIKSGHVVFNERGIMNWGLEIQGALDGDWYLGLDENGRSQVDEYGINIIREAHIQPIINNEQPMIDLSDNVDTKMQTRGIKMDYRALHNGITTNRAGGERAYSVRETILHAIKNEMSEPNEPKTIEEALDSNLNEEWQAAINSEMISIYKNGVWHKIDELPEGTNPLTTKWIFKIKRGAQGQIEKFKARLCVRGFEQEQGIDFEGVFSPVMRHNSLRTLMAIAAVNDLEVKQLDIRTAFLHGYLEEDVYIYAPKGSGYEPEDILKLDKSLYGLKQAPRVFNSALNEYVETMGFKACLTDPCIYVKQSMHGVVYLAVYVDDLLIIGPNETDIIKIKSELSQKFDIEDKGDVSFVLGMKIDRDRERKTLTITQKQYAEDVAKKFRMENAKCKTGIPIHPKLKFTRDDCPQTDEEKQYMKKVPYRSAIGALMYLATCTRPDIAYAVSACASFMHDPGKKHWEAVKQIISYVNATSYRGLIYGNKESHDHMVDTIYLYTDADHAGDLDNRRSRTGYVVMLHGSAVSWKTKLQERVGISSTEVEYYSASEAFSEARWFRMFMAEILKHQKDPNIILEDNEGCIKLSENPIYQYRTKQIDIRHHQLREGVKYGEIKLAHIETQDQVADALTKGLNLSQYIKLTNECMMNI